MDNQIYYRIPIILIKIPIIHYAYFLVTLIICNTTANAINAKPQ